MSEREGETEIGRERERERDGDEMVMLNSDAAEPHPGAPPSSGPQEQVGGGGTQGLRGEQCLRGTVGLWVVEGLL